MEKTDNIQLTPGQSSINKWLLLVVFIAPACLAWLALQNNWFNIAVTNQGKLLQPAVQIDIEKFPQHMQRKWVVAYFADAECSECQSAAYLISQVKIALGREQSRSEIAFISQSPTPNHAIQSAYSDISWISLSQLPQLTKQSFYVIDPLGQVILQYNMNISHPAGEALAEQDKKLGKAILADLRKLLKLSKIG
ncbi:hypothetical protein DS2_16134 [Catenovulum agarivorans DS-2]|uniref:Transmembrane protein n=1 Tax=Catenovulum agarivorans DS-2 TaxID=1328313 RepID=W7QIE4_9ALTE|nr:hypothetical protein [Catenovulum agarivorans]EWH08697.1 hypothetical protein DS2_16134 [Catenovulum agarivorans DS-2]